MGYCTWTPNRNTGGAVAAWIGTGTDQGRQITVTYRKGALGATNKTAACADARNQFCKKYGVGGRCYAITVPTPCALTVWDQGLTGKPLCGDLTYGPDPIKGTGGLSTKGGPSEYNQTPAQRKAAICAKKCGWDPMCLYDKVIEECGGGLNPCGGLPAPLNNCNNAIIAVAGLIVAILILK